MNLGREGIVIAVGAVVALLLQIVVAPNIALFSAQPNFLLAYVLVVAIARPLDAGSALPFALGLVCDLLGSGPVGGYAFLFVIVSFIASRAFSVLDNDTLFMPVTIFVVATFAAEMLYGALLIGLGLSASPLTRSCTVRCRARCTTASWVSCCIRSSRVCLPAALRTADRARPGCDRGRLP